MAELANADLLEFIHEMGSLDEYKRALMESPDLAQEHIQSGHIEAIVSDVSGIPWDTYGVRWASELYAAGSERLALLLHSEFSKDGDWSGPHRSFELRKVRGEVSVDQVYTPIYRNIGRTTTKTKNPVRGGGPRKEPRPIVWPRIKETITTWPPGTPPREIDMSIMGRIGQGHYVNLDRLS